MSAALRKPRRQVCRVGARPELTHPSPPVDAPSLHTSPSSLDRLAGLSEARL